MPEPVTCTSKRCIGIDCREAPCGGEAPRSGRQSPPLLATPSPARFGRRRRSLADPRLSGEVVRRHRARRGDAGRDRLRPRPRLDGRRRGRAASSRSASCRGWLWSSRPVKGDEVILRAPGMLALHIAIDRVEAATEVDGLERPGRRLRHGRSRRPVVQRLPRRAAAPGALRPGAAPSREPRVDRRRSRPRPRSRTASRCSSRRATSLAEVNRRLELAGESRGDDGALSAQPRPRRTRRPWRGSPRRRHARQRRRAGSPAASSSRAAAARSPTSIRHRRRRPRRRRRAAGSTAPIPASTAP